MDAKLLKVRDSFVVGFYFVLVAVDIIVVVAVDVFSGPF